MTILRNIFPWLKAEQHMLGDTLSLQILLLAQALSNTSLSLRFVISANR